MKTVELPELVAETIRLMHEQEIPASNATFIVVTQYDCWPRYNEVLKATQGFLAEKSEFREEVAPARTEISLPPLPRKLSFLSASAEALARLEENAPVIELPLHRERMFGN